MTSQAFTIESLDGLVDAKGLRLRGVLRTDRAQAELEGHLSQIHDHIVEKRYPRFSVDVRALTFVNSSAIRLFVNWVALAERARYKLVFLTDRTVTWHRLSFSVLKGLAPATVEIREGQPTDAGAP
jgi:hypothetical protein